MRNFIKITFFSATVFFLSWLIPYKTGINKLAIQSEDTLPAIFIPVSILKEGTIFLDSYYDMMIQRYPQPDDKNQELGLVPYYLREVRKSGLECDSYGDCHLYERTNYVSAFPIITPLLALPVYFFPILFGIDINWVNLEILSVLSSAFIMALSGGFLYLLLRKHFFPEEFEKEVTTESVKKAENELGTIVPIFKQKSFLLTAIYLFGTINFPHISQALWQHGTVQLFTILALWAVYEKRYILTGLFFGLMLLSRPTSGIVLLVLGLLLFAKYVVLKIDGSENSDLPEIRPNPLCKFIKKICFPLSLGLLPAILFFFWYNNTFYGIIANQGYSNQIFTEWQGRFPEGFLGLWLSPSKGILVYSPVFIFSFIGAYLGLKNWKQNPLKSLEYAAFIDIILLHILVLGFWKHWYGGWSFGYRMASDILPFLVLLLVPFVKSSLFARFKKLFFSLFIVSISCQLMGVIFYDGIWHAAYDGGFKNTAWLWSIRNSELAFNIRRVLVKIGARETSF